VVAAIAAQTKIRFPPDCAEIALDTARQYLGANGLPGSALLMLKLTAVRAKEETAITPHQVLETLAQLSGLPVSILDTRGQLDLKVVRDFFAARVIGQQEAVAAMVERIAMLKAGLNDPDKPIGVFLFAGPTGTGKTELAKAVSTFLFGSVERMIRLDMSEFQTHDSINKILGQNSSGMLEADSLINRVRKQPFSVLLLDEFEKSHPMIWDLFLQAFDEGRLTDAMGQTADLRHCLIILTSNLGATAHRSLGVGFAPQAHVFSNDQVLRAISQTYRPEFQNRLDKVIVFRPLTRELMRGILRKELAALLERRGLKDRAWAIEWEASALEFLLEKGFSPEMGARPLKRAIDQYVVAPLAAIIVEKRFPEGEQFLFVRSDGEGIQVEFVDPDADVAPADDVLSQAPAEPAGLPRSWRQSFRRRERAPNFTCRKRNTRRSSGCSRRRSGRSSKTGSRRKWPPRTSGADRTASAPWRVSR
jgi:ATP-dependent Clp protease ATP-binding subunit ClpC